MKGEGVKLRGGGQRQVRDRRLKASALWALVFHDDLSGGCYRYYVGAVWAEGNQGGTSSISCSVPSAWVQQSCLLNSTPWQLNAVHNTSSHDYSVPTNSL